jgi:hypothetical protein
MLKMANLFVNMFVIWIFCTNYVLMEEPGTREETTEGKTPVFSPDERYQDLFPLTNENFTKNLLRNRDPWILIFHDGSVEKEWKTMTTHLRGLCWFGLVDVTVEKDLLDTLVGILFVY